LVPKTKISACLVLTQSKIKLTLSTWSCLIWPFCFARQLFGVSAMDRFQNIVFQLAQVLGIIVEFQDLEDGLL